MEAALINRLKSQASWLENACSKSIQDGSLLPNILITNSTGEIAQRVAVNIADQCGGSICLFKHSAYTKAADIERAAHKNGIFFFDRIDEMFIVPEHVTSLSQALIDASKSVTIIATVGDMLHLPPDVTNLFTEHLDLSLTQTATSGISIPVGLIVENADRIVPSYGPVDVEMNLTKKLGIPSVFQHDVHLFGIINSEAFRNSSVMAFPIGRDAQGEPVIFDLAEDGNLLVVGGIEPLVGEKNETETLSLANVVVLSLMGQQEVGVCLVDIDGFSFSHFDSLTLAGASSPSFIHCINRVEEYSQTVVGRSLGQPIQDQGFPEGHGTVVMIKNFSQFFRALPQQASVAEILEEDEHWSHELDKSRLTNFIKNASKAGFRIILLESYPLDAELASLIDASNFARIAFRAPGKDHSQSVLGQAGAEVLLGKGDMLYCPRGSSDPIWVQSPVVPEREIGYAVEAYKSFKERDLYHQTIAYVLRSGRASISSVQRQLKIGYNTAASMIEAMERVGLVSSMDSNGVRYARKVIVQNSDSETTTK